MKHTPLLIAALCAVVATGCSTTRTANQAPVSSVAPQQRQMTRTMPVNPPTEATISRTFLGSGEPGKQGFENATKIENDVFHAPNYLPGYPTSATIWPRVVDVPCKSMGAQPQCEGFEWLPSMGRGEYLYFRGVAVAQVNTTSVATPPPMAPAPPPPELKKSIRE